MHVGKEGQKCQSLTVEKWIEIEVQNDESDKAEIVDKWDGNITMAETEEEKYLGDIISVDGRNIKNVKARVAKGKGIIRKIITLLDGIPFGRHFFEVGIMLRNSLLVSSVLFNCEAWYNLTKAEISLLESIDIQFLRSLLNAPRRTPKVMLYLELGVIPLGDVIKERRLRFMHAILNEDKNSLIYRFFQAQLNHPTKKDWVSSVKKDLQSLKINMSFDEIKQKSQNCVKAAIAFVCTLAKDNFCLHYCN